MAIERVSAQMVPKPWGSQDLRPWNVHHGDGPAIGEIWFQRTDATAPTSALLLKLLFTTGPLSIQVHPSDVFARSIGLANGKSEAWYVLSATANAQIALGLRYRMSPTQLRASIDDGSIPERIQWRGVNAGDAIFVPPGTIHAIGAGLVIMEIQQRSDATFRLFDYGRQRELHADHAVAAARGAPADRQSPAQQLSPARTLLVASPHFVLEQLELSPGSEWELLARGETWFFTLDGHARIGSIDAGRSDAIFLEADRALIRTGSDGLKALVAYAGSYPFAELLQSRHGDSSPPPRMN